MAFVPLLLFLLGFYLGNILRTCWFRYLFQTLGIQRFQQQSLIIINTSGMKFLRKLDRLSSSPADFHLGILNPLVWENSRR